jgi:5-carboxyvanillate decarboxylase
LREESVTEAKPYRRIATEEAFATKEQLEAMREVVAKKSAYDGDTFLRRISLNGGPWTDRLLDVGQERLSIMDEHGVDMHVLSLTSTGVQMLDAETAVRVASIANDHLADAIGRHPTRFAGLGALAPQDPARAAKEMERAINTLKLNGFIINSHTNGEFLSDPKYWPILEAAEALQRPIYIHPRCANPAMASAYETDHLEHAIWGYQAETGLHGLRLITGGIFDRFPKLEIVLGHMGEGIPYWFYRIDYMYEKTFDMMQRRKLALKPSEYFKRNFYITTSGVNWEPPLKFNIEVLGADRVIFAIDYPYQETGEAVRFLDAAAIDPADKAKIFQHNAERVFRLRA